LNRRTLFPAALAALALIAAGCGDDNGGETTEEAAATPQEAISEIGAVRQGLNQGLAAYKSGDAERADQLIGDAYLEHFEIVEGPLEEADPELNEELEELIATEIRDEIKAGAPAPEVEALVKEAQNGLDEAEAALGKA